MRAGSANWFVCQTSAPGGRTVRHRDSGHPAYTNVWWARTLSDTGAWGWVSEVYFAGGANDERDAGLRGCSASEAATGTAPPGPGSAPAPAPQPVAPAPVLPQPAKPPGLVVGGNVDCRPAKVGQRAYVRYRLHRQDFISSTRMVNGRPDDRMIGESKVWIGSVAARVSTCRTRWGWRLLDDANVETQSDGIDREAEPRGTGPARGWGIGLSGAVNGRLAVTIPVCGRVATKWTVLKRVLSLPLPGWYAIGLGTWALTTFVLPDEELVCREFAGVPIRLGVNRYGRLTATAGDVFPVIRKVSNFHYQRYEILAHLTLSKDSRRND